MSTALVVDGQNLLMRAIFAARHSHMSAGDVLTGPLHIFINTLAKHVAMENPTRLAVLWDGGTSAARLRLLPSYKAHRKAVPADEAQERNDTGQLARKFLVLAGVPQLSFRGVEADDLIAGAWRCATAPEIDKIVILSSDKDFLQLVGPNPHGIETELVRLSSAGTPTDRWTAQRVLDEHGYRPVHWPLITAFAGDTSDGVPGLRGIGPKKALKLLTAADWDLAKIELSDEDRATVEACHEVVNLRHIETPVGLPAFRPTRPDSMLWPQLMTFLFELEMTTVKERLRSGELWSSRDLIIATEGDETENGRAG